MRTARLPLAIPQMNVWLFCAARSTAAVPVSASSHPGTVVLDRLAVTRMQTFARAFPGNCAGHRRLLYRTHRSSSHGRMGLHHDQWTERHSVGRCHQRPGPPRLGVSRRCGKQRCSPIWPDQAGIFRAPRGHTHGNPTRNQPEALPPHLEGPSPAAGNSDWKTCNVAVKPGHDDWAGMHA